ncbi:MAG: hypothetical protein JJT89_08140 [Nitriliruptoraceae bacterium]|nr:hypothetical protein [Nitriliruptoraceae bacterium]
MRAILSEGPFLPLALVATSLIPALLIFPLPDRAERARRTINLAGAAVKVVLVIVLAIGLQAGQVYEARASFLPGIDLVLRADPIPVLFVFLSALLWFTTTVYAVGYLDSGTHRSRFFGFFSLCVTATIGIALAGNLVTFLIFYELLTVTTYPLVVHSGDERARAAGRTYLRYTITGGAVLLLGTVWLQAVAGTTAFGETEILRAVAIEQPGVLQAIFVLLIAGLGVKAALIGLHGWLPQAMAAPAPVSALLHAVAVVKAGAYGVVRVIHDLYGAPLAEALDLLTPLAIVAAATIVYGSARALAQDDLKRRLAYSTVSQLSYIVLGASILSLASITGALAHLVHQGIQKVTLFYVAGILAHDLGITRVSELGGLGRQRPVTMAMFSLAALGMIGVPPTVGFMTKWELGTGAADAGSTWVIAVLVVSTALNAAYFLPPVARVWFGAPVDLDTDAEGGAEAAGPIDRDAATAGRDEPGGASGRGQRATEVARAPDQRLWHREGDPWLVLPAVFTGSSVLILGVFAGAPLSPIDWARDIAIVLVDALP